MKLTYKTTTKTLREEEFNIIDDEIQDELIEQFNDKTALSFTIVFTDGISVDQIDDIASNITPDTVKELIITIAD